MPGVDVCHLPLPAPGDPSAELHPDGGALHLALRSLDCRRLALHHEITDFDQAITTTVTISRAAVWTPTLWRASTRGAMPVTAGDNPTRLRSEAAFAALCSTSPVEAPRARPSATA